MLMTIITHHYPAIMMSMIRTARRGLTIITITGSVARVVR
jgi:hypothetical protein